MMCDFSWLDASDINNPPDPEKVVASFKDAEIKELELLRRVRKKNDAKASTMPSSSDESHSPEPNEVSFIYGHMLLTKCFRAGVANLLIPFANIFYP